MNKEIEEAVKIIKENRHSVTWDKESSDKYIKATETLLSLAQSYLAVKGMPEEETKELNGEGNLGSYHLGRIDGKNQALHLCKLALLKKEAEWREQLFNQTMEAKKTGYDDGVKFTQFQMQERVPSEGEMSQVTIQLVEDNFPKHQCKERGKAIVLHAQMLIAIHKLILERLGEK